MAHNPNTTRKMLHGGYHKHFFPEENRLPQERIVVRNGVTTSVGAPRANLTSSLGDALGQAMVRKSNKSR
jgi:hypothetical protein